MSSCIWILIFIAAGWILAYHRSSLVVWTISFALLVWLHNHYSTTNLFALSFQTIIFLAVIVILNIPPLRQLLVTRHVLILFRKLMPSMSRTEREALQAGTVGFEAELFRGMPDWQKLLNTPTPQLTEEEQAFLDGPVDEACRLTDDWDITHNRADLPPELWQFLKQNGFFGLIIPKRYGGKEFSASAHLAILTKLYGRSVTLATTVNVPNSLGPAELLLHYGTEDQKNYYLPRLAKGEEIPCFALTGPEAGSDASAIPDTGIVCRGEFEGKEIIGIRLNWNKRYITLAPVATILGLAFKLYDPDHLLGKQIDVGITCALIPAHTPGIQIGRRHFPLNAVFQNGPTQGKDVFIPVDWIIGGAKMAGHGWQMLMECLGAGRAISLPASAVGGAKIAARATGAYARIRRQFNLAIGKFEGIQEVLARITAYTYLIDTAVKFTVGSIDRGEQPAVASAMMKYHATEYSRHIANDAMDIHGGKGICLGPRNYLARFYQTIPIGITVEGANILSRSLIIFGQGAIRCHPYILAEMTAAQDPNGLKAFDKAFFGHIGYSISNLLRALFLSLTSGRFVLPPSPAFKRYYQHFTRCSAVFALVADSAMLLVGGALKRKERLSARLGDMLSLLYLGATVLKRYHDENQPESDAPIVEWICRYVLCNFQQSLDNFLRNFPNRFAAATLRFLAFPYGRHFKAPNDHLDQQLAELLQTPSATRDNLTRGAYLAHVPNNMLGLLDSALIQTVATEPLEKRLHEALHAGKISGNDLTEKIEAALAIEIISHDEAQQLLTADAARKAVITVDDFAPEELVRQQTT
jgi:acyl-CoA dehydrogenase